MSELLAITLNDDSAIDAQEFVAPPKRHFLKKTDLEILDIFVLPPKIKNEMKNCKSSESQFAKILHRSDLCSMGGQQLEVLKNLANAEPN